jgi:dTDP-glucose pyrophosphorylase
VSLLSHRRDRVLLFDHMLSLWVIYTMYLIAIEDIRAMLQASKTTEIAAMVLVTQLLMQITQDYDQQGRPDGVAESLITLMVRLAA